MLENNLSDFYFSVEGVDEFLVVRDSNDCGVGEGLEIVNHEVNRLCVEG